jgi:MT-A70
VVVDHEHALARRLRGIAFLGLHVQDYADMGQVPLRHRRVVARPNRTLPLGDARRPVVTLSNQSTLLHAPVRDHSRKPEEFYALVDSLCPGSKVELFARCERPGWAAHGDQVQLFGRATG